MKSHSSDQGAKRLRAVVLNYNQAQLTLKYLPGLLTQDYGNMEVVVVDNNSSVEDFRKLSGGLPQGVQLVRSPENGGWPAGCNFGIRYFEDQTHSDLTLLINNDVLLSDNSVVTTLVEALNNESGAVAISPLLSNEATKHCDPKTQIQVCRCPNYWRLLISNSCWLRRLPFLVRSWRRHTYWDMMPFASDRLFKTESINGSCFIIKTEFLKSIGYLDEGTFLFCEEAILSHQIRQRNKFCLLHTGVTVHHLQGASTGHTNGRVFWKTQRVAIKSELYLCRKYLRIGICGRTLFLGVRLIDYLLKSILQRWVRR